jgi:hypothetical protein
VLQVQIDPAYQPSELLHALVRVEAKTLIYAEKYKSSNCYEMVQTLIPELNDSAHAGIEINSSKLPALKTLILMSNKQYRSVPLEFRCSMHYYYYAPEYVRFNLPLPMLYCGNLPQSSFTLSASLRESCRLANQRGE